MNKQFINIYLELLQFEKPKKEKLQEILPALSAIPIYISAVLIANFVSLLIFFVKYSMGKEDKQLSKKINKIFRKENQKDFKVIIIDDPGYNAYAVFTRTIYITKPLFKCLTEREKVAISLHEISHIINKDLLKTTLLKTSLGAIIYTCVFPFVQLFPFLSPTIMVFCYITSSAFSNRIIGRKFELRADDQAVKFGYKKEIISGLKKLNKKSVFRITPETTKIDKIIIKISQSLNEHPPLKERIEKIMKSKQFYKLLDKKPDIAKIKQYMIKNFKTV